MVTISRSRRPTTHTLSTGVTIPTHQFIPDTWKQWIATNIALDQPADGLVKVLSDNGFSVDLARLEVETASVNPYVEAARSLVRQLHKKDWFFHLQRELEETSCGPLVPRKSRLSSDEFLTEYYSQNRPVIITDVLSRWPAMSKWNREYFQSTAGSQLVEIQAGRNRDPRYEINSAQHKQVIPFHEYVRLIYDAGQTNDYYMTANNSVVNEAALAALWQDVDLLPEYLVPEHRHGRSFFWMGPAGTVTPVHHDLTNNFMAQVIGRKLVKLISPAHLPLVYNDFHCYSAVDLNNIDYARYPLFKHVRIEEVVLEPGDLLFLPVGWWHHVTSLDVTVTLTFTNFRWSNDFTGYYKTYGMI